MQRVAEIIASVLGWTPEQVAGEVDAYQARVDAERLSQTEPDDEAAEKARLEAPEVRGLISSPVA
jgi:glycerol-3-phosphate dehydrogenase